MDKTPATLTGVLDRLEDGIERGDPTIGALVRQFGARSFTSIMLVFALIAVSPATTGPGVTTAIAVVEFLLVIQLLLGRQALWLPGVIARRRVPAAGLETAVSWLRRPLRLIDRLLRPRLTFLVSPPCLYLWLLLILGITMVMPLMELIPASGTLAGTVIALIATAILTRDGVLILLALAVMAIGLAGLRYMTSLL